MPSTRAAAKKANEKFAPIAIQKKRNASTSKKLVWTRSVFPVNSRKNSPIVTIDRESLSINFEKSVRLAIINNALPLLLSKEDNDKVSKKKKFCAKQGESAVVIRVEWPEQKAEALVMPTAHGNGIFDLVQGQDKMKVSVDSGAVMIISTADLIKVGLNNGVADKHLCSLLGMGAAEIDNFTGIVRAYRDGHLAGNGFSLDSR